MDPLVDVPGDPVIAPLNADLPLDFAINSEGFRFAFADAMLASHARKLFVLYLSGQVEQNCDLFGVELIFGELVGNVVRHAPGPVELWLRWEQHGARLEVIDHGPGYELKAALPEDVLEEAHRGLFIVATYGKDLRVDRRGDVTVTSVMVDLQRAHVNVS